MSVARHRIAAGAILLFGSLGLAAVGRMVVLDTPEIAQIRGRLNGKWVATRVQAAEHNIADGAEAARTSVEFAGSSVRLQGLIGGGNAEGVCVIETPGNPGKVDFKVDAGWLRGIYSLQGDRLTLCVNALKLPEQLGVPTRGYPDGLQQSPGRHLYEFQRVTP